MSKSNKALLFNFLSFAIFFFLLLLLVHKFTNASGIWAKLIAFAMGTIIAPKFQAIKTNEGEKLFMKWLFLKGVKEI